MRKKDHSFISRALRMLPLLGGIAALIAAASFVSAAPNFHAPDHASNAAENSAGPDLQAKTPSAPRSLF